jgi:hypothetical protein
MAYKRSTVASKSPITRLQQLLVHCCRLYHETFHRVKMTMTGDQAWGGLALTCQLRVLPR